MISDKLACSERFRIAVIEGLQSADNFNKAIEFGSLWHACEEGLAAGVDWKVNLTKYAKKLTGKYPLAQAEISKWYQVILRQFPVYIDYWKKHPDVKERVPLLQEEAFCVPYKLPSGRVVYMRGKFDSVDLIGKGKQAGVYLQENKTKGDIDEPTLQKNLTFDLQTMWYLVALTEYPKAEIQDYPLKGVRYNVIRRPFSGGKGSIRQHKPTKTNPKGETEAQLYDRLLNDYIHPEPEYWFMRWTVDITPADITRFKKEFMEPFLENLCCWYDLQIGKSPTIPASCLHWRLPFGIYNPIAEGYPTDAEEYMATGSTVGLVRTETLFPELEEA